MNERIRSTTAKKGTGKTGGNRKTGKGSGIRHTLCGEKELALIAAIRAGDVKTANDWIGEAGINLNAREKGTSHTLLHIAAEIGNTDLVMIIGQANPALLKKTNKRKQIPALVAAERNNWDSANRLQLLEKLYFPNYRFDRIKDASGHCIQFYYRRWQRGKLKAKVPPKKQV